MAEQTHNDDHLFDRLVDGELDTAERQQLLASLDDPHSNRHPDGWRRCALAFLESQTWGTEFKNILAHSTTPAPVASTPTSTSSPSIPNRSASATSQWLAIAASLLVAFGIGWLVNSRPAADNQAPSLAHVEQIELPLREDDVAPIDTENAVTLLVRDTNGKDQRVQVPLMEVEALDDQFAGMLPAELRQRIRNRGFDVQQRRRFAPMFFEQNQQLVPMVVPVDDTYIVPVDRPIY